MRPRHPLLLVINAPVIAVMLCAPAAAASKCADKAPAWTDNTNFSAALRIDDHVIVGTDECGFLQVGRWNGWQRTGDIRLAAQQRTGDEEQEVEVDVEALAYDAPQKFVYAIGSHSKTRKRSDRPSDKYEVNRARLQTGAKPVALESHPERERLYRFAFDPSKVEKGKEPSIEVLSLTPILSRLPVFASFAPLASKENGVDIEGLAVAHPTGGSSPITATDAAWLYVGFRGPVLRHGFVPVLALQTRDLDPLFAAWKAHDAKRVDSVSQTALANGQVLFVPLDGRGIRDLAFVGDGLLVLAGPVGDGDTAHRIYWWNGRDCVPGKGNAAPKGELRWLADVAAPVGKDGTRGKAEALVWKSGQAREKYDLTVLFDSLPNGAPTEISVPRRPRGETPATTLCRADDQ